MTRASIVLLCCLFVAVTAMACADKAGTPPHQTFPAPTESASVGIVVGDLTLRGHLFGDENKTLVILSHMRQNNDSAWFPFAETLAQHGYAALTFNFRGYNGSDGSQDYDKLDDDLRAVIDYMRGRGKQQKIILVGASMGATASLVVAQDEDVAGVVAISPPAEFDSQNALDAVPNLTVPKLLIASKDDAPALDFDDIAEAAAEPKETEVYPGNAHGTDLFDASKNPAAASVGDRILRFLQEQGGP